MRYPKGSIQLNQSRDLPLLRQILRSEFVTHSQLFEFTQLNHYERSRNSFHWRMRRLVDRGLVLRQTLVAGTGDAVYSVSSSAATLLQSMGEYCLVGCGRTDAEKADRNVLHAIGLNEIQLSALRAGLLARCCTRVRTNPEAREMLPSNRFLHEPGSSRESAALFGCELRHSSIRFRLLHKGRVPGLLWPAYGLAFPSA